jgi:hypothetical protein
MISLNRPDFDSRLMVDRFCRGHVGGYRFWIDQSNFNENLQDIVPRTQQYQTLTTYMGTGRIQTKREEMCINSGNGIRPPQKRLQGYHREQYTTVGSTSRNPLVSSKMKNSNLLAVKLQNHILG